MKSFLVSVLFILAVRVIFGQSPADTYAQLCEQAQAGQAWEEPAGPQSKARSAATAESRGSRPATTTAKTATATPTPAQTPRKTIRINPALKIEPVTPLKP
jgi:hypothetical protein